VSLTEQDLESLLGSRVPLRQAKTILNRLGFEVADGKSSLKVTAPYWRGDIHIKEDLIEEVARIIGYDRLPMTLPHIRISDASLDTSAGDAADEIRSVLNAQGYDEVITYALVNKDDLTKVGFAEPRPLAIQNPLSQDQDVLRTTLLPSLLTVAATNINRGQRDIKIFEIGKTYFIEGEKRTLALLATGQAEVDWRVGSKRAVDFYDLKGAVAATLQRVGMNSCEYRSEKSAGFAEGETAVIYSGRKRVGVVGAVDEAVRKAWNIKHGDVYFAQVDLDALSGDEPAEKKLADISGYPPATRDVSLAVPEGITYAQIESVCWKEGRPLLISVQFIEQYLGEKMEKGFRGLVFSLTYQSSERTLREDEVNQLHENICRSLSEQFGVVRR
jgi:phenylalanyl-tRNA synthetase beta chain